MFQFGSVEDVASLYFTRAASMKGPVVSSRALCDMSEAELKTLLVYRRMAYNIALQEGASQEVLDMLLQAHDEVFQRLTEVSEKFCKIVGTGLHQPITGFSLESVNKYKILAGQEPLTDI